MEVSGKIKHGSIREDKEWKDDKEWTYQVRQRMEVLEGRQRMEVSGETKNGSIRGDKERKYYEDEEWKY